MADALLGVNVVFVSSFRSDCTCWNIGASAVLGEKRPLENDHFPPSPYIRTLCEFEFKMDFQKSRMDLEVVRVTT